MEKIGKWVAGVLRIQAFRDCAPSLIISEHDLHANAHTADGNQLDNFQKATLKAPAGCGGMLNQVSHIRWFVDHIDTLSCTSSATGRLLYMDTEGMNLGRTGTISII